MGLKIFHRKAFDQVWREKNKSLDEWLNDLRDAVSEIQTKIEALDDKLNADTGVADENYDLAISAELPEELLESD